MPRANLVHTARCWPVGPPGGEGRRRTWLCCLLLQRFALVISPLGECKGLAVGFPAMVVPRVAFPLIFSPLFALPTDSTWDATLGPLLRGELGGFSWPFLVVDSLTRVSIVPGFHAFVARCGVAQFGLAPIGRVCVGQMFLFMPFAVPELISNLGWLVVIWSNLPMFGVAHQFRWCQ